MDMSLNRNFTYFKPLNNPYPNIKIYEMSIKTCR